MRIAKRTYIYFKFNSVAYFATDNSCCNDRDVLLKLESIVFFFKYKNSDTFKRNFY